MSKIANHQSNFENKLLDIIELDDENKEIVKLELKKKCSVGLILKKNLSINI